MTATGGASWDWSGDRTCHLRAVSLVRQVYWMHFDSAWSHDVPNGEFVRKKAARPDPVRPHLSQPNWACSKLRGLRSGRTTSGWTLILQGRDMTSLSQFIRFVSHTQKLETIVANACHSPETPKLSSLPDPKTTDDASRDASGVKQLHDNHVKHKLRFESEATGGTPNLSLHVFSCLLSPSAPERG